MPNTASSDNNNLTLGQRGERYAQRYYERAGFRIVARNVYNQKGKQLGELDFVAVKEKDIVFVEVKTRSVKAVKFGSPEESVTYWKQKKLVKAVKWFLIRYPLYQNLRPRIDVCAIRVLDNMKPYVTIISNAVEDR